jgi:transposase
MEAVVSPLPDNVEALRALLRLSTERADAAEQRAARVEAELANARARESATEALIAHYKLQIAKLKRSSTAPAPNAPAGSSSRWSCNSRTSRPTRPKTI